MEDSGGYAKNALVVYQGVGHETSSLSKESLYSDGACDHNNGEPASTQWPSSSPPSPPPAVALPPPLWWGPSPPPPPSVPVALPPQAPLPCWEEEWDAQALGGRIATGATRIIFLVRHGQYHAVHGSSGDLTEMGRAQAACCGRHLALRVASLVGANAAPPTIVHSPMPRAYQTAEILRDVGFPDAGLAQDSRLAEGAPCYPSPDWWKPAAEDVARDSARIEDAFCSLIHRHAIPAAGPPAESAPTCADDTTAHASPTPFVIDIVVAHGNVIRYFLLRALQLPANAWLRLVVPHASISTLNVTSEGHVILTGCGDVGFLDPGQVS